MSPLEGLAWVGLGVSALAFLIPQVRRSWPALIGAALIASAAAIWLGVSITGRAAGPAPASAPLPAAVAPAPSPSTEANPTAMIDSLDVASSPVATSLGPLDLSAFANLHAIDGRPGAVEAVYDVRDAGVLVVARDSAPGQVGQSYFVHLVSADGAPDLVVLETLADEYAGLDADFGMRFRAGGFYHTPEARNAWVCRFVFDPVTLNPIGSEFAENPDKVGDEVCALDPSR